MAPSTRVGLPWPSRSSRHEVSSRHEHRLLDHRGSSDVSISRRAASRAPSGRRNYSSTALQEENTMTLAATLDREDQDSDDTEIRPFRVGIPDADLQDLRRRIEATKWPERGTVPDASQG